VAVLRLVVCGDGGESRYNRALKWRNNWEISSQLLLTPYTLSVKEDSNAVWCLNGDDVLPLVVNASFTPETSRAIEDIECPNGTQVHWPQWVGNILASSDNFPAQLLLMFCHLKSAYSLFAYSNLNCSIIPGAL
jgi:hypothetical protein